MTPPDTATHPAEPGRLHQVSAATHALAGMLSDALLRFEESGEPPNFHELQTYALAIQLLHDDAPNQTDGTR